MVECESETVSNDFRSWKLKTIKNYSCNLSFSYHVPCLPQKPLKNTKPWNFLVLPHTSQLSNFQCDNVDGSTVRVTTLEKAKFFWFSSFFWTYDWEMKILNPINERQNVFYIINWLNLTSSLSIKLIILPWQQQQDCSKWGKKVSKLRRTHVVMCNFLGRSQTTLSTKQWSETMKRRCFD